MSDPLPVPAPPAPPPSAPRRYSWGDVAEITGGVGLVLLMVLPVFRMPREELVAFGLMAAPLALLCLVCHLPGFRYPRDYPLLDPGAGPRWAVRPPGIPFGYAFPLVSCGMYYACLFMLQQTSDRGVRWGPWGLTAVAVVGLGAAIALARAVRTRPELEVDETRRVLRWRPEAVWARSVTVPFDAVVGVRVVTASVYRADPYAEFYRTEIDWRSDTGRVRTTRLPMSADRAGVEGVAGRLHAALLGTAIEP